MVKFKRFSSLVSSLGISFIVFLVTIFYTSGTTGSEAILKLNYTRKKGWNRKRCQVLDIIGALTGLSIFLLFGVSMFVFFMLLFVSEKWETSEMEWGCAFPLPAAHDTTPSARYWVKAEPTIIFLLYATVVSSAIYILIVGVQI